MRHASLVLAGLVLTAAALWAQPGGPPPAPAPFDPTKNPEDWLLAKWEDAMTKVDSLMAECEFTSIDKVFNAKDTYRGTAKYLRSSGTTMASLELYKQDSKGVLQKDVFKKYIYTGKDLYDFVPETKIVYVHPFLKAGQTMDNNLLSFIFGMHAVDAKQRYELKWQPPDTNYYYLEVSSKQPQDKKDFKQARLVFLKSNFLVRQVWFVEANGNAVIWEFPKAAVNTNLINAKDFEAPRLEPGWRMEKAPSLSPTK
jgi:TIGR03009 family protein